MKSRTLASGSAIAAILVAGGGCASPPPRYAWQDTPTAIRTMSARDGAIQTFSAACRILLESESGRIELTGALVAQPPNRFRLRAWKFSQAVFDITLNEDGLFVLDKSRPSEASEKLQRIDPARFIESISWLPGFEHDAAWQIGAGTDDEFTITRPLPDQGSAVECIVDKDTLVRKRCVYRDAGGHIIQSLDFDAYTLLGDTVWPMRIEGRGESGSFVLLFDRIDLNLELAVRAFDPPRRAVKQP